MGGQQMRPPVIKSRFVKEPQESGGSGITYTGRVSLPAPGQFAFGRGGWLGRLRRRLAHRAEFNTGNDRTDHAQSPRYRECGFHLPRCLDVWNLRIILENTSREPHSLLVARTA